MSIFHMTTCNQFLPSFKFYKLSDYNIKIPLVFCYLLKMLCDAKWNEDPSMIPTHRRYKQHYITEFPTKQFQQRNFQSAQEIANHLIKHALSLGYYEGKAKLFNKQIINKNGNTYYQFDCIKKSCRAHLQFRWKGGMLHLQQFLNLHSHKIKLTPKKAKTQEIKQYLMDLPAEDNIEHHIEAVRSKFGLTQKQAKYIKSKLFWRFGNEDQLFEKLTQRNVTFRRDQERGLLLICSQTMKVNYLRYGDLICFDVTYKLLKKKKGQSKHLGVGFFVGQDQNTRIVLFGMNTIADETSMNFKKLFEYFFEVMNKNPPLTILTDDQKAVGTALQMIKKQQGYQYNHMLDWYHKIEGIKRRIRRQHHKDALFPLFCRLLKEPSKQIYADIVRQIAGFLKKEEIMIEFLREQHKFCLSQVPCSFFGFGVSSTRAQSMNNLIKRSVSHQTNLGKLVFFVLRVERRLIDNMNCLNYMNEKLLSNLKEPQLHVLSNYMQHLAFDQIRQYYEQSRQLQIILESPTKATVPYLKYDRPYKFNLRYNIQKNCWQCECSAIFKTGMPCSHLVKAILKFKGKLGYYINERWYHLKDAPSKCIKSRPFIAKNRRRI